MDLLADAPRRMGPKILNIQAVLPLAVNGFDRPPSMVQVDEFPACVASGIHQGGHEPAVAKTGAPIPDQAYGEFGR